MTWICDECGDVSEHEDDPCSCDPDHLDRRDLIAELRRLRAENARLSGSQPPPGGLDAPLVVPHLAFIAIDMASVRRGGSSRKARCICGWSGPERGTLEIVTDDATQHEKESR